ncbi:alkaline phosphatase-like [Protopterus annectens]|uniref:alkaline phosphatase-like n=1 Tax=Protopterus annectens TaxID=7888 RepID=UPI001CFBCF3E|nr:alkaline phosphatase-like [Protopterus annectens]
MSWLGFKDMAISRLIKWCCIIFFAAALKEEENPNYWRSQAQNTLQNALAMQLNTNVAKNVLLFLGDGMGIPTVTAARILKGQLSGQSGEETMLAMDTFSHVALSKTYSVDLQVSDSASTGTAYLCGVKTNSGTIGISAAARNGVCKSQFGNEVTSILNWAKDEGKSVGIVTTTRVQHATPASTYAHTVNRKWYADSDLTSAAKKEGCQDVAYQMVHNVDIDVIMGGGRIYMTPKGTPDPEYPTSSKQNGVRGDGLNLITEWQKMKTGKVAHYVWNKADFDAVDPNTTDYLLALFEPKDMKYELDRDPNNEPSITEMTEKAIQILQKNPKGFFLLVEGGRIDMAHHDSRAAYSLYEAVAMDMAITRAQEMVSEEDSLIVVTADHSHTLSINGYPFRGNSILGKSPIFGLDFLPYTTLLYGNGPGFKVTDNSRPDIRDIDTGSHTYIQQSAVPTSSETHGGEDVAIFASGPMSHLFHGVHEQNYIAHVMAYAACIGENQEHCRGRASFQESRATENGAVCCTYNLLLALFIFVTGEFFVQ